MTSLDSSSSGRVVLFDFDGTLSKGDSGWRFLLFCLRPQDLPRLVIYSFLILAEYFSGQMGKDKFKERCFGAVMKGRSLREIRRLGKMFASSRLKGKRLYTDMMQRLYWHKNRGDRCILVSASLGEYLQYWAVQRGFEAVLATRLEGDLYGRATGCFMGRNCYGAHKLTRILSYLKMSKIPFQTIAYGNSEGDFEMLDAVLEVKGQGWFVLPGGRILSWKHCGAAKKLEKVRNR